MKARCEDPNDTNAYWHIDDSTPVPSGDWRNIAERWRLSMDLNGGAQNNNASNAKVLTRLILDSPELDPLLPSMAEASQSSRPARSLQAHSTAPSSPSGRTAIAKT